RADWNFAELKAVGQGGSQGRDTTLEVTKCGPRTTVARDLLVMIADNAKGEFLGEVPHQCPFDMKLGSGFVICLRVLPVEGKSGSRREFPSHLGIEPRHGTRRVESPMIKGDVGVARLAPRTNRNVEEGPEVPMPVSLMPTDEGIRNWVAEVSCAFIEVE